MKSSVRAFGIGLFIAGASIALTEQFPSQSGEKNLADYEQQLTEYEAQIASLNEQLADQNKGTANKEITVEQSESKTDKQPTASVEQNNDDANVTKATIYIYENVSIYTIGQQAEDLGIVTNGRELELYLAKPEYARSIQKGAFDLRSDMTIEQIAKVITGQPIE